MVNSLVGVTAYGNYLCYLSCENERKTKTASEATTTLRTRHWIVAIWVVRLFY